MRRCLSATLLFVGLAACSENTAAPVDMAPSLSAHSLGNPKVVVCHQSSDAAHRIDIASAALPAHLAHGDHVARFEVDPAAEHAGDGVHFKRITDAVLAAREVRLARGEKESAACRITIDVAAGAYRGSFDPGADPALERLPLLIDVPDISLRGALRMQADGRGRATGAGRSPEEVTSLQPDRPLAFLPNTEAMIVVVGHPGGFHGNGAEIEGFAFGPARSDAAPGGMGIIALRARGLLIRGNRFDQGLTSAADLRSTSARIDLNYGYRLGVNCGFCLAGPGDYEVTGNRLIEGGLGGIYVSAALAHMPFSLGAEPVAAVEADQLPSSAAVRATIFNNDLRGHKRLPIGFAVRVLALGPGTSDVPQSTHVSLGDNEMSGNTFGLILDAGFPAASTLRRGNLDVALSGNSVSGNCQSNLLVAFTRHTGALGVTSNPYLVGATFQLELGGDLDWADAWYSHPPSLGNTLTVNGTTLDPGAHVAYDPTRPCT